MELIDLHLCVLHELKKDNSIRKLELSSLFSGGGSE